MRPKATERKQARELRRDGEPLKRIAAELGVSVGSVHRWTRDIDLSPEQRTANLRGPRGPQNAQRVAARAKAWADTCRDRRRQAQMSGRERARNSEPLHMAGCMLYWGEGTKNRNTVQLANSDVHVVAFFWRVLQTCFGLSSSDVSLSINVYTSNGLSIEEVENRWLQVLDLPRSCCRKHVVDHFPTSSSGLKLNRLPYGVCTLRVKRSTWLVQHIYGAIQEYAGFEELRWLDGPARKRPARTSLH